MSDDVEKWDTYEELAKSNPNLGVSVSWDYLAEEIAMPEYDNFGDLDGNGKFTVNDITFLQRYLAEDF